jgi:uncharacterized coiled-coil protein SlyX
MEKKKIIFANLMEKLQQQITELNCKMDKLQQIVERLSFQLSELGSEAQYQSHQENQSFSSINQIIPKHNSHSNSLKAVMEHKDILFDGSDWENGMQQKSEQTLAPEIQIRRLTAQLTAAYNRIAALEEQLLARRIPT